MKLVENNNNFRDFHHEKIGQTKKQMVIGRLLPEKKSCWDNFQYFSLNNNDKTIVIHFGKVIFVQLTFSFWNTAHIRLLYLTIDILKILFLSLKNRHQDFWHYFTKNSQAWEILHSLFVICFEILDLSLWKTIQFANSN